MQSRIYLVYNKYNLVIVVHKIKTLVLEKLQSLSSFPITNPKFYKVLIFNAIFEQSMQCNLLFCSIFSFYLHIYVTRNSGLFFRYSAVWILPYQQQQKFDHK